MNEADNVSKRSISDDNCESAISVEFSNRAEVDTIDLSLLQNAIQTICRDSGITSGEFSVAIVGNNEMQQLHRQFLGVDETTDVMSFPLESDVNSLIADLVVCWDVACENSRQFNCEPFQELLLYVVHGTLHLVGFDDTTDAEFQKMRAAEVEYMTQYGFSVNARDHSAHPEGDAS